MVSETIVDMLSIVITSISIIVTVINTIQSARKHKHQKSNRQSRR